VTSFLAWLAGADPKVFEGAKLELRFQHPAPWVYFVAGLLVVAFVTFIYLRDGRETASRGLRVFLAALRILILSSALLLFTEPALLAVHEEHKPSTVLVLLDDSRSMNLKFAYADDKLQKTVKDAMGEKSLIPLTKSDGTIEKVQVSKFELSHFALLTRLQVACQALRQGEPDFAGLLKIKGRHQEVHLRPFSHYFPRGDAPKPAFPEVDFEPLLKETRLGEVLRRSLQELQGVSLAGVVLISDGRQTAGEDPVQVAGNLYKLRKIPLCAVGVGDPSEPKDLAVAIEAPDVVLPEDYFELLIVVTPRGYTNLIGVPIEIRDDEGKVVTEQINTGRPGEKVVKSVKVRREKPGRASFEIKVKPQDGELNVENNQLTHIVQVVDKKIRVLYVEGQDLPRWEYRFLKNALLRDHTIEADVLLTLTSGDGASFHYEGTKGRPRLESYPVNKEQLHDKYDVLILGDLDPSLFTRDQVNLIQDFVREGGGLMMIAGERYAPARYVAGLAEKIGELLPIVPSGAYAPPPDGYKDEFQIEWTEEGRRQPWTILDADENANRMLLDSLPRQLWYYPVRRAKALARVVAVHPEVFQEDRDEQEKQRKLPLIAFMPYGQGYTMFFGVDGFWRWRKGVGDRYHYRLHNQAIRFLATGHRPGQKKQYRMDVDKQTYSLGDQVLITAQLKDRKFEPLAVPKVSALLRTPKGETVQLELALRKDQPGFYEGRYYPDRLGQFKLEYRDREAEHPEQPQAEIGFKVEDPQVEMEEPRMNEELLRQIASASAGGKYFSIDQLAQIPELLTPRTEIIRREKEFSLWDRWPVLFLFVLLITAEWILRKRGRML
jgi:hypothetical protein